MRGQGDGHIFRDLAGFRGEGIFGGMFSVVEAEIFPGGAQRDRLAVEVEERKILCVAAGAGVGGLAIPSTSANSESQAAAWKSRSSWARVTRGMDFRDADRIDDDDFNRILWRGIMGNKPYPSRPTGKDLSQNRDKLLARYRQSVAPKPVHPTKPAGN